MISQATALRNAIKEYEANKWKHIGQKLGKPAKVRSLASGLNRVTDEAQACEQFAKESGFA